MASKLFGDTVIEEEQPGVRQRWRVVSLEEPRGREPTLSEREATSGLGAPAPRAWRLDRNWRPLSSRRGPSSTWSD